MKDKIEQGIEDIRAKYSDVFNKVKEGKVSRKQYKEMCRPLDEKLRALKKALSAEAAKARALKQLARLRLDRQSNRTKYQKLTAN